MQLNKELLDSLSITQKVEGELIALNYSQYNSPKFHYIADKCRGLIVDKDYNIVSRSFDRFYNYGETSENISLQSFTAFEKIDGSLIKVYNYNGQWNISTRGTCFGENKINDSLSNITYKEAIYPLISKYIDLLNPAYTYMFEFVSPFNRIVVDYGDEDKLYYLSSRHNQSGNYFSHDYIFPKYMLPNRYHFSSLTSCVEFANKMEGLKEGFVIYDDNNLRPILKIRNPKYVEIHWRRSNGNLTLKSIISLYVDNDLSEYLTYFPSDKFLIDPVVDSIRTHFKDLNNTHDKNKNLSKKDYAAKCPSYLGFKSLDCKKSPYDVFKSLSKDQKEKYLLGILK